MIDPAAETAMLHVSTDISHPLAGVGFLATIALPFDPPIDHLAAVSLLLNNLEHQQHDFVPRNGAWGARSMGTELVYSMFWPTADGNLAFQSMIMNWMVIRATWLRENFWLPGLGLDPKRLVQ